MRHSAEPHQTVAHFYEAALCPALWGDALDGIADLFGARGALLTTPRHAPGQVLASRGMVPVLQQFHEQNWHTRDARTLAALKFDLSQTIVTDHLLFTEDAMARSDYYEGFARSADVPWFCAAMLDGGGEDQSSDLVALSLQRTAAQGPFDSDDLAKLRALMPHLRNAAAIARHMGQYHAAGVLEGMDRAGTAAAILSPEGKVLATNARFDRLKHDGLRVKMGRLHAGRMDQQNALAALIAAAAATDALAQPCAPLILRGSGEGPALVLRAAPYRGPQSLPLAPEGVLISIADPAARITPNLGLLRTVYALTAREAQIMALLGEGRPTSDIAELLGLSRETIRFHLKAILGKTGSHRQADLIALCQRLADPGA